MMLHIRNPATWSCPTQNRVNRSPRAGNSGCPVTSKAGAIRVRLPINRNSTKTSGGTWPRARRWLAAAHVPDLKPARDQVFEHFYFAIQAALEGLGVMMGPLALISDELRAGRLLAPIREPATRTRGYFVYAPTAGSDAPAVAALRKWLAAAGSLAEAEFPTYLSAKQS